MRFTLLILLILTPFLSACNSMFQGYRMETTQRLASKNQMYKRVVTGGMFTLTTYERIHNKGGVATVYIEGDGQGFFMDHDAGFNPTPVNPIGMQLAAIDPSKNVIYMGRPCQYTSEANTEFCPRRYWTTHRYAPEVIDTYQDALDQFRRLHDISAFHIVGYDGGAAIALLTAAKRNDVLTVRTVAGVLDHAAMTNLMDRPALNGSVNPVDVTGYLRDIPQHHFIGGQDEITPPAVFFSYKQAMGLSPCLRYTLVEPATHIRGWYERWDRLLQKPVDCNAHVNAGTDLRPSGLGQGHSNTDMTDGREKGLGSHMSRKGRLDNEPPAVPPMDVRQNSRPSQPDVRGQMNDEDIIRWKTPDTGDRHQAQHGPNISRPPGYKPNAADMQNQMQGPRISRPPGY